MKLEISSRKKARKFTNMYKLNNLSLNQMGQRRNQKGNFKKYVETNENGNTIY